MHKVTNQTMQWLDWQRRDISRHYWQFVSQTRKWQRISNIHNPSKKSLTRVVSLPVASNVTTFHDSVSISHFIEKFHVIQIVECGKAKKNSFMAMCGESPLEYYWRCFRIATGEPASGALGKTIMCNCYSHSTKAARILCTKYYGANVRMAGVYWINVMFSCFTISELDAVLNCFLFLQTAYSHPIWLQKNSQYWKNGIRTLIPHWRLKVLNEIDETHLPGIFYPSKLEDLEHETKSPFLC